MPKISLGTVKIFPKSEPKTSSKSQLSQESLSEHPQPSLPSTSSTVPHRPHRHPS